MTNTKDRRDAFDGLKGLIEWGECVSGRARQWTISRDQGEMSQLINGRESP